MTNQTVTHAECTEFLQSFSESVSEYIRALLNCEFELCEEITNSILGMKAPLQEGPGADAFNGVRQHFRDSLEVFINHNEPLPSSDINSPDTIAGMMRLVQNVESTLGEIANMHCCAYGNSAEIPVSAEYAEILRKHYPSLDIAL